MDRSLSLLMAVVVALGNGLPARILYHCSTTGQRNMTRCCCNPAAGGCAGCRETAGETEKSSSCCTESQTSGHVSTPADDGDSQHGEQSFLAASHARCCSVTLEKTACDRLLHVRSGGSEWVEIQDLGHLLNPNLPDLPPADAFETLPAFTRAPGGSPPASVPLFLLHRTLLI